MPSYAQCRAWAAVGAQTEDGRYSRLRDLEESERHVRALPACVAEPEGKPRGRCVRTASVVTLDQLEPFLAAAAKELEIEPRGARRVSLVGVRRIPLIPAGASGFGAHPDRADVGYDRVDALLAIYRLAPAARTRALVDPAAELLGPVLRDSALLAAIAAAPSATPDLRRAAVVGLAVLGVAPGPAEVAMLQTGDVQDGRAVLLARTLAGESLGDLHPRNATLNVGARRIANGRLLTALG